jgi:serine/alanine racemase
MDEGIELRNAGITGNILVLGYTAPYCAGQLYKYGLIQTLVSLEYAKQLDECFGQAIKATLPREKNAKLKCHLALDTGMHRIGIMMDNIEEMKEVYKLENLNVCGLFSHLCVADSGVEDNIKFTQGQIDGFFKAKDALVAAGIDVGTVSIQNSFGTLNYSKQPADYARYGILMYGLNQDYNDYMSQPIDLKPVMTLKTHIECVRTIQPGETVGYGRTFKAERPTKIATCTCGYADGVPRELSGGKLRAIVNGHYVHGAGRICMDQMMLDVTDVPDVKTGDVAVLIGKEGDLCIPAEEWTVPTGSITNALLSALTRRVENCGFVK